MGDRAVVAVRVRVLEGADLAQLGLVDFPGNAPINDEFRAGLRLTAMTEGV
jgi:hypothetical protein